VPGDSDREPEPSSGVPARAAAQAPGVRLLSGRYRLGEVLGYGGMAEVYRAHDVRLDRDVAIKVLRSDLARDPSFQARFRREAQSAAALNHPMVVAVYDTGSDDKHDPPLPYIVMQYVEGRTLREVLLHEGRLTQHRAIEIVIDVCAALDYSHRASIVHRDIKPGNVMITPDGSVKVMDFGIARAVAQSTATVTQTAAVMGTAQYLSPEQARGEKVDARSDLYSAGVVLYELLTGQPPFQGDSPVAVAYQHVREDAIPPSDIERDLPGDVDAVVMKALAKNPANRYQSAGEMTDDLGRLLTGRRVLATPLLREQAPRPAPPPRRVRPERPPRPPHRRLSRGGVLLALVLLLLAAGAVTGGLLLARSPSSANAQVQVPPVQGLTLASAERTIRQTGLVVGKTTARRDPAKANTVLSSDPAPGTKLDRKAAVGLTYSSGPGTIVIPPGVIGENAADAAKLLQGLGFNTRFAAVQAPLQPVGTVSGTSPLPGATVEVTPEVVVTIDVVNNETTVPNLNGVTAGVAQNLLTAAALQTNVVQQDSKTVPDGLVFAQSASAQGTVTRGTVITITISHNVKPSPTPTPKPKPTHRPRPSISPTVAATPIP
jgi:eukaryotic-like serine/threonine-protein kinase